MIWEIWIDTFVSKYCCAKGLRPSSMVAYREVLNRLHEYSRMRLGNRAPSKLTIQDICNYVEFLRVSRANGNATINKAVVIIKSFYRCAVSYEFISPQEDPTRHLPKMKRPLEIAGDTLSVAEMNKLANAPDHRTVVGIRDRAMLLLLCTTGIRASECEGIRIKDVDYARNQVRVNGKGGHERKVNLNDEASAALKNYLECRPGAQRESFLFRVRTGNRLTRYRIYERVQYYLRRARIFKQISPHRLRHSFATNMIKAGTNIVVLKELLGHVSLTSTMRYIKISGEQLRDAVSKLKIDDLFEKILEKFPVQKRRYQRPVSDTS